MYNYQSNILVVDDSQVNLEMLHHILKPDYSGATEPIHHNYRLSVAKSGRAALTKIAEDKPDLILLDIVMPDMSGFDVLTTLKKSEDTKDIPVIFITGLDSIEDEERGFALGAVDYIAKPFHNSLVRARVRTHLRIVDQMRMIESLGLTDSLTNMLNRRGFDSKFHVEWNKAIKDRLCLSLLMIDIDRFKRINDTYGHQQGDVVLKTVAQVLKSSLKRQSDIAARWGGEEFAVLLPDASACDAKIVAEEIRCNIECAMVSTFNVTVSVGVASTRPSADIHTNDLFEAADKALYAAKDSGRNTVFVFKQEETK